MKEPLLYSIRMRASANGRHLSGAERLAERPDLAGVARTFIERALSKGATPAKVVLTIDEIEPSEIRRVRALDLTSLQAADLGECREQVRKLLADAGVGPQAVEAAFHNLDAGPSQSGGNMRGAMIMDAATGDRLEPDRERGVRASRFDWSDGAASEIDRELGRHGLTHFRTREALALATKVAHAPEMVAELCWSDDPDYTAGYVASRRIGYVRLSRLKQEGVPTGGRAFFVRRDACDLEGLLRYLQEVPVLIAAAGLVRPAASIEEVSFP